MSEQERDIEITGTIENDENKESVENNIDERDTNTYVVVCPKCNSTNFTTHFDTELNEAQQSIYKFNCQCLDCNSKWLFHWIKKD